MFNVGAGEMILIALVLLIAVGPEQLPGVIRRTGRVVGQLKSMSDNLRRDFNASLEEIERAADVKSWVAPEIDSTIETVKEAVEPFRIDPEKIDGSTKVSDIWSNPPPKSDDTADTEGGGVADGEMNGEIPSGGDEAVVTDGEPAGTDNGQDDMMEPVADVADVEDDDTTTDPADEVA